ncbi:MAG: DNA glycosylase AlkZ-like family protein [Chloroflexota bacterium]
MRTLTTATILAERLRRQGLTEPVGPDGYLDLFAALQPLETVANTRPGDPPRLVHRTCFDDGQYADELRGRRGIVKGRFQSGRIAYALAQDLALYATAFRRPLAQLSEPQRIVLDTLRERGPLTPRQLKQETGRLNKELMPILHRLQEAFLVFEDQADSDWERGWYDFATEWPDANIDVTARQEAVAQVLLRFLHAHVFATLEQVRDWSGLPTATLPPALATLEGQGAIIRYSVPDLGDGWLRQEDVGLPNAVVPDSTFMLHAGDPLVRAAASELKRRYGEYEVLQYLLIDGIFAGVVTGHWRIGPHDVDDIVVGLPPSDSERRHDEIIAAVATIYHAPDHRILRYVGTEVNGVA